MAWFLLLSVLAVWAYAEPVKIETQMLANTQPDPSCQNAKRCQNPLGCQTLARDGCVGAPNSPHIHQREIS
ncbi:hypothetical protein CSC82_08235 [Rhodobacteraceae bacterium 4F10]|nr:hypothetical protein CSC82_08235 [Rhodobacteraceae bacterium 4F10]